MVPRPAPLDVLVENIRSALNARRLEALASAEAVRDSLERYVSAIEHRIARTYASDHQLKSPTSASDLDPASEARRLLELVQCLPELKAASESQNAREAPDVPPGVAATGAIAATGTGAARSTATVAARSTATANTATGIPVETPGHALDRISRALQRAPLVIVGGVAHPERLTGLDDRFRDQVEWIDTTRQGTHAIGNLERRIREGRVSALVMLEGSLSHKHYDPLVAAARHVALPCAYAGKGGRTALSRALLDLEEMLAKSAERS